VQSVSSVAHDICVICGQQILVPSVAGVARLRLY
jgi:hypothetical protein